MTIFLERELASFYVDNISPLIRISLFNTVVIKDIPLILKICRIKIKVAQNTLKTNSPVSLLLNLLNFCKNATEFSLEQLESVIPIQSCTQSLENLNLQNESAKIVKKNGRKKAFSYFCL